MKNINQPEQKVDTQYNAEKIEIHHHHHSDVGQLSAQLTSDKEETISKKSEPEDKPTAARQQRQARQISEMRKILDGQDHALKLFGRDLDTRLSTERHTPVDAKSVITVFNQLPDDEAIECIETVFCQLCDEKKYKQAEVVGRFAELFLPVLFEYDDHLDRFRAELKNSTSGHIESPTHLPVPTETMMAEAETKPVQLKLVSNKLVSPLDLGSLAEVGLDENNTEAKRQIDCLLSRRLLSAEDQEKFESSVDAVAYDIAQRRDHAGALVGKSPGVSSRASVSRILKNMFKIKKRRFYYCFKAADEFDPKMMAQLGQAYPLLVFLLSRCTDESEEEERYSFLSHIIAVGKGASISEELE